MKNKSILVLIFAVFLCAIISQVSAADFYQNTSAPGALSVALSVTDTRGIEITINNDTDMNLSVVSKYNTSNTATVVYVMYKSNLSIIAQKAYVGVNASFTNVTLSRGQVYVIADNNFNTVSNVSTAWNTLYSTYSFDASGPIINQYANVTYGWISSQAPNKGHYDQWQDIGAIYLNFPSSANVVLISPGNNTFKVLPVIFNSSITPTTGFNIANATLTLWNTTSGAFYGNTTYTLPAGINGSTYVTFTNSSIPFGNYTWNVRGCWGNAQPGNCSYAGTNYTIKIVPYLVNATSYTTPISTATSSVFYENITTSPGYSVTSSSVVYNGTYYPSTIVSLGGVVYVTTTSVISATVLAQANASFYWTSLMSDGNNLTSATYNQTVNPLPSLNVTTSSCSAGFSTAMIFSLFNEVNITVLNGTFNYNFKYGSPTSQNLFTANGNISNAPLFNLCFNNTLSNLTLGYGQISYNSPGMDQRTYYVFTGTLLSNNTQNVSLYDLFSTSTSAYKFLVEDNLLNLYEGNYISLIRWYPELNQYNVVDMGITDSSGNAVLHAVSNDVDYRFGLYNPDGTLVYLAPAQRLTCSSNPCEFTLKVPTGAGGYSNFQQIQYSFTFNNATNMWVFAYSDPTGTTQAVNLTVYKYSGNNIYPICSQLTNGPIGAVNCDTTGYTGDLYGLALQENGGSPVIIAQLIENVGSTSVFSSTFGLWLTFLIALPIAFLFVMVSPILGIVGGVIALVPAMYFGSVTWAVIGAFAVLGGIAIHMIRRSQP